jgi:hypothetical protein
MPAEKIASYGNNDWDELPSLMRTAAARLGHNEKTWDNRERPARSDICWSFLTPGQKRAANCLEVAELARGMKSLHDEIANRRRQPKERHNGIEGTANGCEDSVDSRRDVDSGSLPRQHQSLTIGRDLYLEIQHRFLHEYNYAFPACMSLLVHCVLYFVLHAEISKVAYSACHAMIVFVGDWHFVNNHFDPTSWYTGFLLVAILFSVMLARLTGSIYNWNDNDEYQRRLDIQLRNRWRMGCWDVRIMNWFSGDEMSNNYGVECSRANDHRKTNKWGPRIKVILDVLSFYVCLAGVEFLGNEFVSVISNAKESILEGLPSRRLDHQWAERKSNENAGNLCKGSVSGNDTAAPSCIDSTVSFMSDVLNWATNADRCGWVKLDEADEEVHIGGSGKDEYAKEGHYELGACKAKGYDEACVLSNASEIAPKKTHPWRQSKEEWKQRMNILDDEYLRANISIENYYLFVGDPHVYLVDPKLDMIAKAALAGISYAGLSWFGIPFMAL